MVDDSLDCYAGRDEVQSALMSLKEGRVRYVRHSVNQGACAARNMGMSLSSGRYVDFLDDDDEWLPEKLEKQLLKIREVGGCALVSCSSITVNDLTGERKENRERQARGMVFDSLILENFIGSTSFPLIRKE